MSVIRICPHCGTMEIAIPLSHCPYCGEMFEKAYPGGSTGTYRTKERE